MPYLDPASRAELLGPLPGACPECGQQQVRHYCRTCDEFIVQCWCHHRLFLVVGEHVAHRLYIWTLDGVVAQPPHPEGL